MKPSTPESLERLARANQKILADGESLPAVTLRDGSKVQTGTLVTMIYNVQLYNEGARGKVEDELELAIPTLFTAGLFDLFPPDDWIQGDNPGRRFVGILAQRLLDRRAAQG